MKAMKLSFTLHVFDTDTSKEKRSSNVILIQNNDIKETVPLNAKCMGSNAEFFHLRYGFAKSRSKVEKFCLYWLLDAKK